MTRLVTPASGPTPETLSPISLVLWGRREETTFALARYLGGQIANLLAGGTATDPVTFIVAPTVLAIVALFASVVPAHRAGQMDPLVALQRD